MSDDEMMMMMLLEEDRSKERKYWVHPINKKRKRLGEFHRLVKELQLTEDQKFKNYTRLSKEQFADVLEMVAHDIQKGSTNFREAIRCLLFALDPPPPPPIDKRNYTSRLSCRKNLSTLYLQYTKITLSLCPSLSFTAHVCLNYKGQYDYLREPRHLCTIPLQWLIN